MNKWIQRIKELLGYAAGIGFFHLVSANILIQIAGFGMQIFLARILPKESMGRITTMISFYSNLVLVAQLGINTAIVKLCSEKITEDRKLNLTVNGLKLNLITTTIVILGVYIASFLHLFSPNDESINVLMRIYILQLPFVIMNYVGIAFLQSQSKIKLMSRYQIITRSMVIIALVLFSFLWGIEGYVAGVVVANFASFLMISRVTLPSFSVIRQYPLNKEVIKTLINYSKYALMATVIFQLINSMSILLANYMLPDSETGIAVYGMAVLFINGLIMIPSSYNQIMVPKLSHICDDMQAVKVLVKDYQKKMLLLVSILFVGSYIVIPWMIPILLGPNYAQSGQYFRILAFGLFTWGLYSPIGNTFMSIGKVRLNIVCNLVVLTTMIIIDVILLPRIGYEGLAYGFVISNGCGVIVNRWMLNKVLKEQW